MRKKCLLMLYTFLAFSHCEADDEPVRIGVIQSLTGLAAEDGNNVLHAAQLAANDLTFSGKPVELLVEDDKSTPKETVSAYQALKQKSVDAMLVGPYSFTTEAVIPLGGRDGIVIFNSSGLLESFDTRGANGLFFNNSITIEEDVKPFRQFLDSSGGKSAVVISVPTTWGKIQSQAYTEILTERGIAVRESIETTKPDHNDWDAIVTRLAAAKPELLILLLNNSDINLLLKKAAAQKLKAKYFGSKNTYDAWRLTDRKELYEGVCFNYPYHQLHSASDFVSRFRAMFKEEPRVFADASYDAVTILQEAVIKSRAQGKALKEVLTASDFKGLVGNYRFTPRASLANSRSSLVCVRDGSLAVSETIFQDERPKQLTEDKKLP